MKRWRKWTNRAIPDVDDASCFARGQVQEHVRQGIAPWGGRSVVSEGAWAPTSRFDQPLLDVPYREDAGRRE
eukprot:5104069-Alexandrium_andersonii.AAC.1